MIVWCFLSVKDEADTVVDPKADFLRSMMQMIMGDGIVVTEGITKAYHADGLRLNGASR